MSPVIRKPAFWQMRKHRRRSAQLISDFVFAIDCEIPLQTKFQASSHLLWLNSPIYVGPGLKVLISCAFIFAFTKCRFSHDAAHVSKTSAAYRIIEAKQTGLCQTGKTTKKHDSLQKGSNNIILPGKGTVEKFDVNVCLKASR